MMKTAPGRAIHTKYNEGSRPTRIAVELAGGCARLRTLDQGYFLGGRPMHSSGSRIRLALVGIHLALLGGDAVDIQVQVGAGATLEVIEPSGMVAYDADGQPSAWRLTATLGAGATLIWHGATFVAAKGSHAGRSTTIALEPDARALLKETLVLGRTGESAIWLKSRMQASLEEQELLVEELAVTPETRHLPGGVSRVISTIAALGMRPGGEVTGAGRLDLAGPGALWRAMSSAAHSAEKVTGPVFRHWRNEVLARHNSFEVDALTDSPPPIVSLNQT